MSVLEEKKATFREMMRKLDEANDAMHDFYALHSKSLTDKQDYARTKFNEARIEIMMCCQDLESGRSE